MSELKGIGWAILAVVMFGALSAAWVGGPQNGAAPTVSEKAPVASFVTGTSAVPATGATPLTTFPRTVLVETFTAVWCPHCPAETAALFNIDQNASHSVLTIAELHSCYYPTGQGPCYETYQPTDGTTAERATFYNICGYPDVFFDGQNPACGASTSVPAMQTEYENDIANASAVPATVGIQQSAWISSAQVSDTATVTSGVTGTYNAITYLVEYIDKLNVSNGNGPHDLAYVVRSTLNNHPVTLTAGTATTITATGPLNASWNANNLSVVTFVQDNASKAVLNANMAVVGGLTTLVGVGKTTLDAGSSTGITVDVSNSSSGAPVAGAAVTLSASAGGSFSSVSGTTAANGTFSSTFTAPVVTSAEIDTIAAHVNASGVLTAGTAVLSINPLQPPSRPNDLTMTPGNGEVTLDWNMPLSGSGGVSYAVFRSTTESGGYSLVAHTATTQMVASGLVAGEQYWFQVAAFNVAGFSANTTAISATPVALSAEGLPSTVTWWWSIGTSGNFSAAGATAVNVFLPDGTYAYTFGAASSTYVAAGGFGTLTMVGILQTLSLPFVERMATLQGSVAPADATVLVDNLAVSVVNGGFTDSLLPGTYNLTVSAPGFKSNTSMVTLTAGKTTNVTVALLALPGGSGPSTLGIGGLSQSELIELVIVAAVIAMGLVLAVTWSRASGRRRANSPPGSSGGPQQPGSGNPP
jgi:hypothetical protein